MRLQAVRVPDRTTAVCVTPAARAMVRVLHCVASVSGGRSSSVLRITRSTSPSVMVRAPGRGASSRPSSRWARNRVRHLPTVPRFTPAAAATSVLAAPVALARMMAARSANARAVFGRRLYAVN